MRILRFDSVGGASGDMILGVLIGLGADPAVLERELDALLPDHFHLRVEPAASHGIHGLRATVDVHDHEPHHHHDHDGHGHDHDHDHDHGGGLRHAHRTFADISNLIAAAALPEPVKDQSIAVFRLLAEAEGLVHGIAPEEVGFHEVGAVDSIVDIVGCCLAFFRLGIDAITVSPLPTGVGSFSCAHGVMPIPAPATAEILKRGLTGVATDEPYELLTPTGAALLACWPRAVGDPECRTLAVTSSFGRRKLKNRPNLLRGMLLETAAATAAPEAEVIELAANIDDLTPELTGELFRKLLEAGALDVGLIPMLMKKQRPGTLLSVIARAADRERLLDLIFRESTTFGIREYPVRRHILDRDFRTVETAYGPIRIKIGRRHGEEVAASPEFEDCRAAAERCGAPVKTVMAAALGAARG